MVQSFERVSRLARRQGRFAMGTRAIPEESAIAFSYNGGCYAVMMASPQDLTDFAYGFSLTEQIVTSPNEIERLDIVEEEHGIELRMWLSDQCGTAYRERRRHLAGPTGCGLCGVESLSEALRVPPVVHSRATFRPEDIMQALDALGLGQALNRKTNGVHAAGFWSREECGLIEVREDVGRHNALDKLAGALACRSMLATNGFVIFTSRVSIEMVRKAAMIGVPLVVAISAPTALAVRVAEAAGITIVAVARKDGFEVFTHPHRILPEVESGEMQSDAIQTPAIEHAV